MSRATTASSVRLQLEVGGRRGHHDGQALAVYGNVAGDPAVILGNPGGQRIGRVQEGSKIKGRGAGYPSVC